MISDNSSQQQHKSIASDIMLVLFVLVGVFFLLSLFSYSKLDPSFSNIVFSKYQDSVSNWFGKVGAYVADVLGTAFGWAALLLPFLFFYISILLYRYKKGLTFMLSPLAGLLCGLGFIIVLSMLSGLIGGMDIYFYNKPAGGAMGVIASSLLSSLIGRVGGIIVSVVLLLVFFMLLSSVSLSDMGKLFKIVYNFTKPHVINLFQIIKTKLEEKIGSRRSVNVEDFVPKKETAADNNKPVPVYSPDEIKPIIYQEAKILSAEKKSTLFKDEALLNNDEIEAIASISFQSSEDADVAAQVEEEPIFIKTEPKNIVKEEVIKPKPAPDKPSAFKNYAIPFSILKTPDKSAAKQDSEAELRAKGDILIQKLKDFGIDGKIRAIKPGPVVTMFEIEPAAGTRISKIASLESDLALSMSALSIRIIAPIPGKNTVGIEIPNKNRASVLIKELIGVKEFSDSASPLTIALGKDAIGNVFMSDVRKMPHLLVAGTTGSGKSVGINTMICSILYKSSPDKVKFIMIDPKMVELSIYEGIPHLLAPVVTDTKLAASVLKNVVAEMTKRYSMLAEKKVRNIDGYNELAIKDETMEEMSYLVVIVDEFADLMMVAGKDVEVSIARIAQMARAVGIHLIIATQRPTANVITGLIKANMPARLAFKVSQKNDSRIILDQNGADTLLGYGDSLFIPPGTSEPVRIHGAFISDEEVRNIVEHLKQFGEPEYNMDMLKEVKEDGAAEKDSADIDDEDDRYEEALRVAYEKGVVSISMIQRYLKIGYNRAARIVEMMEARGIIAPSDGTAKPREVIRK